MTLEDVILGVAELLGADPDDISMDFKGTTLVIKVANQDEDDYDDADDNINVNDE